MIRRVKREVPIYAASSSGTRARAATLKGPDTEVAGTAAAAKLTGDKGGEKAKDEPYGSGPLRLARDARPPSGYTIKGNEDSMLYHTPDSPSYKQTIAGFGPCTRARSSQSARPR